MITAIKIPSDETVPAELVFIEGLSGMQAAVGGLIEVMDIDRPDATLITNEEAKLIQLPVNRRATLVLWTHLSRWRGMDLLRGDVLVVGRPDEQGTTTGVPEELITLFFETSRYKYEVTTLQDGETWSGNQRRFDDVWDAYNAAQSLAYRWVLVDDVRVVRAED